ncbi:MAG: ankyrin repeat domain-containing protein [Bacillota bacterium]
MPEGEKPVQLGNVANRFGRTPLMCVVSHGHRDTVKLLLEVGADINAVDIDGWTPLMFAVRDGTLDIVRLLIQSGANTDITDRLAKRL